MSKPRILFFGYSEIGFNVLSYLFEREANVIALITHEDNAHEKIWFKTPALSALEHGVPVFTPASVSTPEWIERIRELKPDLILSVYYRHMIHSKILEMARLGAFNLHGSLLPKYRGRAPINWAIVHGATETGLTLHRMVRRADAGAIVDQEAVPIGPRDTAEMVFRKILPVARRIFERQYDALVSGTVRETPQDDAQATLFGARKPDDGKIDWKQSTAQIFNLIRAVTDPYPGAFTIVGSTHLIIWWAEPDTPATRDRRGMPGEILSLSPLVVATGDGALELVRIEWHGPPAKSLRVGQILTYLAATMPLKVLILGANGFIGSSLTTAILKQKDWEVYGMDIGSHKLTPNLGNKRFKFVEGDITINLEWIEYHVKKCDVVIPLVAIANPAQYVKDPLRVFELDFEANLAVVRLCAKYKKRILFPSTSEVYGMCPDAELDEATSPMVYGPIEKQRWIYACSKQLLDRVIYAYGIRDNVDYTLFRPFNWIGPQLDNILEPKEGSSRLFTQFISNIIFKKPIQLVDGGSQSRSFTFIDDGVDALLRIIENKDGKASRQIFNIGNPANEVSVAQLAKLIIAAFKDYPDYREHAEQAKVVVVPSAEYFGKYYQDIQKRVPSIAHIAEQLGWTPKVDLKTAIKLTLDYHLSHKDYQLE
jgi:UDP-4-amino-4-deoxy-L-arabinose formyltransferase / UDP-glucuronic acid dehydrogenase (UDP-4-keto-hexauronic acid decarboxylating)